MERRPDNNGPNRGDDRPPGSPPDVRQVYTFSEPPLTNDLNQRHASVDPAGTEFGGRYGEYTAWLRRPDGTMVRVSDNLVRNPGFEEVSFDFWGEAGRTERARTELYAPPPPMPPGRYVSYHELFTGGITIVSAGSERERRRRLRPFWHRLPDVRRRHHEQQVHHAARRRARLLLKRFCSPEQWREYVEDRRLTVETSSNVYVLTQDREGGVAQLPRSSEDGVPLRHQGMRLCISTRSFLPIEDTILAQKLAIENDEVAFLRQANFMGPWDPYARVIWASPYHAVQITADTSRAEDAVDALAYAFGRIGREAGRVVSGLARVVCRIPHLPHTHRPSCCGDENHEADGNWCRRVFSRFFRPVPERGRISPPEYAAAEIPRCRCALPGFEGLRQ